jgi:hypothetical protein
MNWPMEFPQKAFENEARRLPLASQERMSRLRCHFAGTQTEPLRLCRRRFCLSHAAMGLSFSMAK